MHCAFYCFYMMWSKQCNCMGLWIYGLDSAFANLSLNSVWIWRSDILSRGMYPVLASRLFATDRICLDLIKIWCRPLDIDITSEVHRCLNHLQLNHISSKTCRPLGKSASWNVWFKVNLLHKRMTCSQCRLIQCELNWHLYSSNELFI